MNDITIKRLSRILDLSERRLRQRANKEGWPSREPKNPHNKGKGRAFLVEGLPADIRNKVIQSFN